MLGAFRFTVAAVRFARQPNPARSFSRISPRYFRLSFTRAILHSDDSRLRSELVENEGTVKEKARGAHTVGVRISVSWECRGVAGIW